MAEPLRRADRVHRPLGLTLALLATIAWYALWPLVNLYFLRQIETSAQESFLGGGVRITAWDWINAGLGGVILVLCLLAWIGRPSWIRFGLILTILVPTLINLYRIVEEINDPVNPILGGSAQEAWNNVLRCQLPGLILVPLYVTWYLNRAPARAFYRRVPLSSLSASPVEHEPAEQEISPRKMAGH